ncbi:MAG TPA: hypothetical protein VK971_13285, partial [Thiohalobacter sp.]|nr:hypothetical protein [Thiohalobacter sp.]
MRALILFPLLLICNLAVAAGGDAPWGTSADNQLDIEYAPHKVVYDISVGSVEQFEGVLDRASYLNNLYGADPFDASIVLVLHGNEIHFF